MRDGIIGWTIMAGNPTDGFTLYGKYEYNHDAFEAANRDAHLDDWWIAPIYEMGD